MTVKRQDLTEHSLPDDLVEVELPAGRLVLDPRWRASPNRSPEISEVLLPDDGYPYRVRTFEAGEWRA